MKDLKVVIAAGGDGTRLGDLNPKGNPKSLLFFNEKPLISYQLDSLVKLGLYDIYLSFNKRKHINEFRKYLGKDLVPKADYSFGTHNPFNHPHALFRSKEVIDFIKNDDFLFTQGDLVVEESLYKNIFDSFQKKHCSVITKEKARSSDKHLFIEEKHFLKEIKKSKCVEWRYGGIYVVKCEDINEWISMAKAKKIKTINFFKNCLENNKKIYIIDQTEGYININKPNDFLKAQRFFEKKLTRFYVKIDL